VGINFVSHAHVDHLPYQNGGTILSSEEINQDVYRACLWLEIWFIFPFPVVSSCF